MVLSLTDLDTKKNEIHSASKTKALLSPDFENKMVYSGTNNYTKMWIFVHDFGRMRSL